LFSLNRERILLLTELQNPNATHQQQPFNHHTTNRTMARTKRFARNIPGGNYPNGYPKLMPSTVSPHMYPPASGGIKKKEKRSQLPLLNGDEDQASSDDDPVGVPSMVTVSDDGEVEEQEPPSGDTQLGAAAAADTPLDDIYTASAFVQDVKALLARLDKAAVAGPSADIRASSQPPAPQPQPPAPQPQPPPPQPPGFVAEGNGVANKHAPQFLAPRGSTDKKNTKTIHLHKHKHNPAAATTGSPARR
jgi:hypothetical protein